jgi:hypothetical protein
MSNTQETAVVPFVSQEVKAAFAETVADSFGKYEKAARNLVGNLLTSARSLERIVTDDDFKEHLAKAARKAIVAKGVGPDSVNVYMTHTRVVVVAATGRPEITDALPLGSHWADQRTNKRKLEGVNAYYNRVKALLKIATRNEQGHLILPEGYSLLGELTSSVVADTPAADTPADTGSAGQSSDQEGGINVDPKAAAEDARMTAATVLLGSPKAAAAFLALLADSEGKASLSKLITEHARHAKEAAAKAAADAKAGEAAAAFAQGMNAKAA